jgi:ATP-dependent Clp protease ATP-binding subunit ClpA
MVSITAKSWLFSIICALSSAAFAGDIRPVGDYLVIYHEAEEHFAKKNLPVKAGIYLYRPELLGNRSDVTQGRLSSGGIWNSPFNKDEQVLAGYSSGEVLGTRNEIWANFATQSFLIQNQQKENQRIAKGVPKVIVPVIGGAFLAVGDAYGVAFVPHQVVNDAVARKPFDAPKFANPVRYAVTRDGESLIYLSSDNQLVMIDKAGQNKILAKPAVSGGQAQIAFSADGFFLQDGDKMMYTAIGNVGEVSQKQEIFEKKSDETYSFRENNAIVKAPKPAGGFNHFFLNPEGNLSTVSSKSTSDKLSAEEMNVLMSYGEDWGRRSRLGNFDLEIPRPEYNSKVLMALKSQTNSWVSVVGPYGIGQESMIRAFVKAFTNKRNGMSPEFADYEVFAIPLSSFIKCLEAAKAAAQAKQENPMDKLMGALKNKKVIVIMENFLDDPNLGPTDAPKAMGLFMTMFREEISAGTMKIISTANSDVWDKAEQAMPALRRLGTVVTMSQPSAQELNLMLSAKLKKLADAYNVAFSETVAAAIISTAKELAPLEIEPMRSYKVAESLAKEFGTIGKKGQAQRQITLQDAKRYLLSNVFDSKPIENIDIAAFRKYFDNAIVGQSDAKDKILGEFASLSLGVVKMDKPLATMLFVGPTGVGKTESVRVIADYLKMQLIKVDMNFFEAFDAESSQYKQIKAMEGKPFVLLMDEIDKSENSATVLNNLRGLIDTGIYAEGTKNEINLRNAIIIMTGNYAQHLILERPSTVEHESLVREVRDYVLSKDKEIPDKEKIPLHFWSRIENSVVVFRGLETEDLKLISLKFVNELRQSIMESHKIDVTVSEDFIAFTVNTVMENKLGAVPVKERITKTLKREISAYISKIKSADPARAIRIKKIYATNNAKGNLALIDNTDPRFPQNLK